MRQTPYLFLAPADDRNTLATPTVGCFNVRSARSSSPSSRKLTSVTICRELKHSDQTIKSEHVGTDRRRKNRLLFTSTPALSSWGRVKIARCQSARPSFSKPDASRRDPLSQCRAWRRSRICSVFSPELNFVVLISRINCSIRCWRIVPSWREVSSATVFAIASITSSASSVSTLSSPLVLFLVVPRACPCGGWRSELLRADETVARSTWRTRCRAILFQRVCRRHLYIGASV